MAEQRYEAVRAVIADGETVATAVVPCAMGCLRHDLASVGIWIVMSEWVSRVAFYRAVLRDAGFRVTSEVPSSSSRSRPLTFSRESFEVFAGLAAAPTVLGFIALYAEQSGLRDDEDFAVSCLPSNNRISAGLTRATAISVGGVEVFVATIDRESGDVFEVAVWTDPGVDLEPLDAWPSVEISDSHLDGGGITLRCTAERAPTVLSDPQVGALLSGRIRGIRGRRARSRRHDWHNRWLWALVESGFASPPVTQEAILDADDVTAADAYRLARQRTSQQKFRALLLERQVNECVICGIELLDVLEAAHLIPHAKGGSASLENGRLLCANHHRAYDAGLYQWIGNEFTWTGKGPELPLGGR